MTSTPVPAEPAAAPARGRAWRLPATFAALRHRNYRLLWCGTLVSHTGDWMDQLALNWLVYQLTGSALLLALFNFCRLAPILVFTLLGGMIADRVERRRLLFSTQTVALLLALLLAVLVSTHQVTYWLVLVIGVGRGVMMSFNQPARQSLISELVPPADLSNAIALNAATINLTRVLGPVIGGLLIAAVGVAGAFYLNAASFVAVLYGLSQMRFPARVGRRRKTSMVADLRGGAHYLRGQPALRTLVLLALVPMILGTPYQTMLTVFAHEVLDTNGAGLGLLTAFTGVGAIVGALTVAAVGNRLPHGKLMFAGLAGFALALLAFAAASSFWLALPALAAIGVSQQCYRVANNTLIQTQVDPEYRSRVLSTLFLNRGMAPLGTMVAGILTTVFNVQIALGAMALAMLALALLAARLSHDVWRLE